MATGAPPLSDTGNNTLERYYRLALLPAFRGHLPPHVVTEWILLCGRLAAAYLANPTSEEALYNILAAGKLPLSSWRDPDLSLLKSIIAYPAIDEIKVRPQPDEARSAPPLGRQVRRLLKQNQLRRAAALLRGPGKVLPASAEVLSQLKTKFPAPARPGFTNDGNAPRASDFDDDTLPVHHCFKSFSPDVSGGISGWSQPLLSLALKNDTFVRFIKLLTRQIVAGTAPGRAMLTSSLLTPLAKNDGGVRPIACPELIYRLCAKFVLAAAPLDGALLPTQLGLGSPGGVEPIVYLAQQVADGRASGLTHVTSIDFKNVYGSLFRNSLAQAIRTHAPSLYRLAKLRYGQAGEMVVASDGEIHVIRAEEGVYQGDPLAGFLFFVGTRTVLELILKFLQDRGFNAHMLCYLDDWTIFAGREGVLEATREFFADLTASHHHCGLEFNVGKCWERSAEALQEHGKELLGTMIGGVAARRAFLFSKTLQQEGVLEKLGQLHRQDALLLLRISIQHQLRHLQRLLPQDDLDGAWATLDACLHHALRLLRDGAAQPRRGDHDSALFQLPLRLGGLGIPTHELVAPHARAAMEQSARRFLQQVTPTIQLLTTPSVDMDTADDAPTSQAARVAVEYKRIDEQLMRTLDLEKAQTVVANGSRVSCAGLQTFPMDARTILSDRQVQVLLHHRTLLRAVGPTCPDCQHPNIHDTIKHLLVAALRRVKGTQVNFEPRIEASSMRRTDWRIHGTAAPGGGGDADYDITFISITNATARTAPDRVNHQLLAASGGMRTAATARLHAYLDFKARDKANLYTGAVPSAFVPLVFSLEGAEHPQVTASFKHWRSIMPSFSYMLSTIIHRSHSYTR